MLELVDIRKTYEGKPLLEGVSIAVSAGETVCLLGPSGSGKSTLLRIAAGLEGPDSGRVLWNGRDITDLPPHRREFGLMFQDYALFPHLDVAGNVAFGLRMKGLSEERIRREVEEALARVDLDGFRHRRIAELSGGEQQRVALARALAPRPGLLMLDEPLGALDRALREQLAGQLRRLLRRMRIPSLYVTHDQEEAFAVGQRVALLHSGRIVQSGPPEDIAERPASKWAAEFLGLGNILPGKVRSRRPLRIETRLGVFAAEGGSDPPPAGGPVWLLLRPGGGSFRRRLGKTAGGIRGVVTESVRRGETFRIVLRCESGGEIVCADRRGAAEGERRIWVPAKGRLILD
jgi:spermidine/putrescine transport system ATP-binding protein